MQILLTKCYWHYSSIGEVMPESDRGLARRLSYYVNIMASL